MMEALLAGGLSLVGGWAGAYLGGYLKKKGENLATHEDINQLVDQVRAVTQTTKEIEAKISSDVWNKQKQWEMKREVLFSAAKSIVDLDNGLLALDSLLRVDDPNGDQWAEARHQATSGFRDAQNRFDETRLLVAIACSRETSTEFENLGVFVAKLGARLTRKDTGAYGELGKELARLLLRTRLAIRKDLGVEGTAELV